MKPCKQLPTTFSVLLIVALLVACTVPAVAPPATPVSPPATLIPSTPTPVAEGNALRNPFPPNARANTYCRGGR